MVQQEAMMETLEKCRKGIHMFTLVSDDEERHLMLAYDFIAKHRELWICSYGCGETMEWPLRETARYNMKPDVETASNYMGAFHVRL